VKDLGVDRLGEGLHGAVGEADVDLVLVGAVGEASGLLGMDISS